MQAAPAHELMADRRIFVITLCSATHPIPIRVPFVHELVGFSVFRSRIMQGGHEQIRLHVGYFDSLGRAREALPIVRRYYASAYVATALDDTLNTPFRVLKTARARVVAGGRNQPLDALAFIGPQHYVVQLTWSGNPVGARSGPAQPAFRPYNLYSVRTLRDEGPKFGLRLGFFGVIEEARNVAEQAYAQYPDAIVLPVSHREYTRASELIDRRRLEVIEKPEALSAG